MKQVQATSQKMRMTPRMRQAFYLMEMPLLDLIEEVRREIDANPILEPHYPPAVELPEIEAHETLFSALMRRATVAFDTSEELSIAEALIGHLDDGGLLTISLDEIEGDRELINSVLAKIQQFAPAGIGARSLQEACLLQLEEGSELYHLVKGHWDLLLHHPEEVADHLLEQLRHLDLHPGFLFDHDVAPTRTPDIIIGPDLRAEVCTADLPPIEINTQYLAMREAKSTPPATRAYLNQRINSAKWLYQAIEQRRHTLQGIADYLVTHQQEFFSKPKGDLIPMTMREVAHHLNLHESTITRAVAGKTLDTPRGPYLLRSLFSATCGIEGRLKRLIEGEDRTKPYSDQQLAEKLGVARRTVTKHRTRLKLGSSRQR